MTEPARRGTFKTGSSWWPFQLHYGGKGYEHLGDIAGMGNTFTAQTGFQPGDPDAWKASVDYALDGVARDGWSAWYGAAARGIYGHDGVSPNAQALGIKSDNLPYAQAPPRRDDLATEAVEDQQPQA